MSTILVIGAGPAGSVFAARMAQLGHEVTLIERTAFPRSRLGESLSPGVLPLVDMIGARGHLEHAGFRRVHQVSVKWERELEERRDPGQQGLIVDRGVFDAILLDCARAVGVRILQPASIGQRRARQNGWTFEVEAEGRSSQLHVDFVADATGRTGAWPGRRRRHGVQTIALYAYWRGSGLPDEPRIEAGCDAWYWGVPLPDGRYNTLAFVDPKRLRIEKREPLQAVFRELVDRSGMLTDCRSARLDGPVRAADATPYVDEDSVTPVSIKVGDAAVAIDPLSSTGVQKAVQTALAGAVVANTLLRKPESRDAAMQFYRTTLEETAARHRGWAAAHYAQVASRCGGSFWEDRAADAQHQIDRSPAPDAPAVGSRLELSPLMDFVEQPCLEDDFVTMKVAIRHPQLAAPLAYLGGFELTPLLRRISGSTTLADLCGLWADRVPATVTPAIVGWLLEHRVLRSHGSVSSASALPSHDTPSGFLDECHPSLEVSRAPDL